MDGLTADSTPIFFNSEFDLSGLSDFRLQDYFKTSLTPGQQWYAYNYIDAEASNQTSHINRLFFVYKDASGKIKEKTIKLDKEVFADEVIFQGIERFEIHPASIAPTVSLALLSVKTEKRLELYECAFDSAAVELRSCVLVRKDKLESRYIDRRLASATRISEYSMTVVYKLLVDTGKTVMESTFNCTITAVKGSKVASGCIDSSVKEFDIVNAPNVGSILVLSPVAGVRQYYKNYKKHSGNLLFAEINSQSGSWMLYGNESTSVLPTLTGLAVGLDRSGSLSFYRNDSAKIVVNTSGLDFGR